MKGTAEVVKIKDVVAWIQGRAIAIQAATREGEPVELDAEEARRLAAQLQKLATTLDHLC